jgi:hypothetical protein
MLAARYTLTGPEDSNCLGLFLCVFPPACRYGAHWLTTLGAWPTTLQSPYGIDSPACPSATALLAVGTAAKERLHV